MHTNATLTHDGGGDSLGIASMVRYAIQSYGVDTSRIFATGVSSGAMMTNVLCGAYPDLFKAGSASAGVAFGCFAGPDLWNSACATGTVIKTPQEWVCNFSYIYLIEAEFVTILIGRPGAWCIPRVYGFPTQISILARFRVRIHDN